MLHCVYLWLDDFQLFPFWKQIEDEHMFLFTFRKGVTGKYPITNKHNGTFTIHNNENEMLFTIGNELQVMKNGTQRKSICKQNEDNPFFLTMISPFPNEKHFPSIWS